MLHKNICRKSLLAPCKQEQNGQNQEAGALLNPVFAWTAERPVLLIPGNFNQTKEQPASDLGRTETGIPAVKARQISCPWLCSYDIKKKRKKKISLFIADLCNIMFQSSTDSFNPLRQTAPFACLFFIYLTRKDSDLAIYRSFSKAYGQM